MAYNLFGTPITTSTLHSMPQYIDKVVKRRDRALVAFNLKNAQDKDKNAQEYAKKLKQEWGDEVATVCLIYNATGNPLTLDNNHDWSGRLGQSPLPTTIGNGQWAVFLHTQVDTSTVSSEGAVVYRDAGESYDFMVAWSNVGMQDTNNLAYTQIRKSGNWDGTDYWGDVYQLMKKSKLYHSDSIKEYDNISTVSIGNGPTAIFEAIFTAKGIPESNE